MMPMPRRSLELIQRKLFISPSQEEILQNLRGWDDEQQAARIMDETPNEYPEESSQSSLHRVFDVTGSSLSEASHEAVEWASLDPSPGASDAAIKEEDSYNEAFESDRSQSPSSRRRVPWNLSHGNSPKSMALLEQRTNTEVVVREEFESREIQNSSPRNESNDEVRPAKDPKARVCPGDVLALRPGEKRVCPTTSEEDGERSPCRPPRVVQDKLDKLRSLGAKKARRGNSSASDRLRIGDTYLRAHFMPKSVMDVVRCHADAYKPAPDVTAAELLKTSLRVGTTLPLPFHAGYFRD